MALLNPNKACTRPTHPHAPAENAAAKTGDQGGKPARSCSLCGLFRPGLFQATPYNQLTSRRLGGGAATAHRLYARLAIVAGGFVEQLAANLSGSPEYYQTRGGGTVDGFLGALYQDALGRSLDAQSKGAWEQALAGGVTQAQAGMAIYGTLECDLNTVQGFYQKFLHRPADTGGQNALAGAIAHGAHDEDVVALLLATDEYLNRE